MAVTIERESVEYLSAVLQSDVLIGDDPPEFAFTDASVDPDDPDAEPARPEAGDWVEGTWQGATTFGNGRYRRTARTPLIGSAPLDLDPGEWQGWVRVPDDPELPVMRAGVVYIG